MGFLKRLPSFNKRNRNKIAERSPVPTSLDALKEDVKTDLLLNVTPLGESANMNAKTTTTNSDTTPSTTGFGLFDDIFTELNQKSSSHDSLRANASLTFALSQQLQLESTSNQHQTEEPLSSSVANSITPSGLCGQDSIYSRYVTKSQQHHDSQPSTLCPPPSNAGVALSSYTNTLSSCNNDENKKEQEVTTQMVLDSDVSGSDDDDEDEDDEASSEDEIWGTQQQQQQQQQQHQQQQQNERKLDGACPITERRPNDHRWNTDRHEDQHGTTVAESNQTMLNRMKNRHRQQVKLQNNRPQPPSTMRPISPMHCVTSPPLPVSSAMIVPPLLQRNSPINTLTRSSSANSTYRQHGKPWISDYSPSKPSPLAPNRSLRPQPSTTTNTTSLRSTFTMNQVDEADMNSTGTGECSDDHEDADDEADHDTQQQHRLATINTKKHIPTIHHSSSVPDLKNKKRQGAFSPSSSNTLVSDQQSTVSLSSSSSSSTSTTTTSHTPSPTPLQRCLFTPLPTQRLDDFSIHRMRTMTSEPDLKQLASMPQHYQQQQQMNDAPMNGYNALYFNQQQQQHIQQQRQRLQLELEMMQLYQREQQLKQEYMLLQQRSFFSPMHKSATLPSLSTAYQDPRFCYTSSSSFGPGLY